MKLFFLSFLAIILTIKTYAQAPDKALVQVHYNFIHIQDTTQRDKPLTETMLLVTGKNASFFTSYDMLVSRVKSELQRQEMLKNGLSNMPSGSAPKRFLNTEYYFFFRDQKFFNKEQDPCINGCMIEDGIARPEWKILKDTMSFSGISCQKAMATFKGRNWIAWFAAEIPLESGPWKLNGLPGLILEAYDDKKEVQWKFAGVKNIREGDVSVDKVSDVPQMERMRLLHFNGMEISTVALSPQINFTRVTKKEYDKLKAASEKDPDGFYATQRASRGISVPTGSAGGAGGGSGGRGGQGGVNSTPRTVAPAPSASTIPPRPVINNPIELKE